MLIDHKARTIKIDSMDEMMSKDSPLDVDHLDQRKRIFYLVTEITKGETENDLDQLDLKLKSMEPAFNYLIRFDIHDYKVILKEEK